MHSMTNFLGEPLGHTLTHREERYYDLLNQNLLFLRNGVMYRVERKQASLTKYVLGMEILATVSGPSGGCMDPCYSFPIRAFGPATFGYNPKTKRLSASKDESEKIIF